MWGFLRHSYLHNKTPEMHSIQPPMMLQTLFFVEPFPISDSNAKYRIFFQMGCRKLHFLLTKSQNFEKNYKIILLENSLSYNILQYCSKQGCFGEARAFSVISKSAPFGFNFDLLWIILLDAKGGFLINTTTWMA